MAETVERLAVLIEANTKSYERAMERLESRTRKAISASTRSVASLDRQIAMLSRRAAAFAATFGVGLGLGGIKKAIDAVAELGDAAERAGVSAQTLQVFRVQLEQNGGAAKDADEAIRRLNRRLGEFANSGGGPAEKAFKALDISIRDAAGNLRSTDSIFAEAVDKLGRVKDQAQVAALSAQLFGDDAGPRLLAALRQGTQGLRETEERMRRLGILMDRETIEKAKDLNDQFTFLGSAIQTRFQKAVIDAIGPTDDLGASMDTLVENVGTLFDLIANNIGLIGRAATAFAGMKAGAALGAIGGSAGRRGGAVIGAAAGLFAPEIAGAFSEGASANGAGGRTPEITVRPMVGAGSAPFVPGTYSAQSDKAKAQYEKVRDALKLQTEQLGRTNLEQEIYNNLARAGVERDSERGRVIETLTVNFQKQKDALDAINEAAMFTGDILADALEGIILRGEKAEDVLKNLVSQLAQAALQATLLGQGPLAGIFGTASASGGLGGLLGSLFGLGRAGGGPVNRGMAYPVGERGPEIFVPNSSGRIVAGGGDAGGSVTVVQNFDFRAADPSMRPFIESRLQQVKQEAIAGAQQGIARTLRTTHRAFS